MDRDISIALGSDHAGFDYKSKALLYLKKCGYYHIKDFGTNSDKSVDYPDIIHPLSRAVDLCQYNFGIIFCGTGNGVCITANKYPKVRAALCWRYEIASLARKHNDANILALPSRFMQWKDVQLCIDAFLKESFESGRHLIRVKKISKIYID